MTLCNYLYHMTSMKIIKRKTLSNSYIKVSPKNDWVTPIFRILRIQFVSDIFLPGSGYHVTGRCGCARWSDLGMGLKHGFCCLKKKINIVNQMRESDEGLVKRRFSYVFCKRSRQSRQWARSRHTSEW